MSGLQLIKGSIKDLPLQAIAAQRFTTWFNSQDNMTSDMALKGALAFSNVVKQEELSKLIDNLGTRRERRTERDLLKLTEQIGTGVMWGVATVPANLEDLTRYASEMLAFGQVKYPELNLKFPMPDFDGQMTGVAGTAVLRDTQYNHTYAFVVRDGEFVLRALNDNGGWDDVAPRYPNGPPLPPVRTQEEQLKLEQGIGLTAPVTLSDWRFDTATGTWIDRLTGFTASPGEARLLNQQEEARRAAPHGL